MKSTSRTQQAAYVARCPVCDVRRETSEPNGVVEFYRRHRRVTGHDVEFERANLHFPDGVEGEDVETVLRNLDDQYRDGVPVGVVAAAMADRGVTIGETLDRLHDLRMTGLLYEPRDDHLSVF